MISVGDFKFKLIENNRARSSRLRVVEKIKDW